MDKFFLGSQILNKNNLEFQKTVVTMILIITVMIMKLI